MMNRLVVQMADRPIAAIAGSIPNFSISGAGSGHVAKEDHAE